MDRVEQSGVRDHNDPDSDGFLDSQGSPPTRCGGGGGGSSAGSGEGTRCHTDSEQGVPRRNRRPRRRGHRTAAGPRAEDLKTYDPKSIGPDEYVTQMTTFLERRYLATIHSTIVSAEDQEKDYALAVNAQDLIHFDSRLAYMVLHRPDLLLELMREALGEVQARIVAEDATNEVNANADNAIVGGTDVHGGRTVRLTVKGNAHIRITHLPPLSDLCKPNISAIRGTDLGALIQIQGTVIRSGAAKMLEVAREYRCQNKSCGAVFSVHSDMSQGNLLVPPVREDVIVAGCNSMWDMFRGGRPINPSTFGPSTMGHEPAPPSSTLRKPKINIVVQRNLPSYKLECGENTSCPGVGEKQCKGTRFMEHGEHKYSDYQEIKVQEQAQKLSVGSIPRSMVILLQDDLVDSCKAGDDVVVVGELLRRWMPVYEGVRCDVQVTLRANSVTVQSGSDQGSSQVSEELRHEFEELWKINAHRPLAVRNHVVASVCPQVFGLFTVKLAILLTLIGGVTETDPRGMRRRGTPHLLVVGDPGCGKSQFLRFAAKLSPRSVLTTGVGTTSAGLTCSAVKDGGEWMLEAGALVLADRGLCCIDEFSAIREHDRATIHEAMEQQTLSVAKAGLVCKLNARTTVFAVTNTKGNYDAAEDMTVNTAIGSPLLSRFDLVLLLLDTKNKQWDKVVSTFVLRAAIGPSAPPSRPKAVGPTSVGTSRSGDAASSSQPGPAYAAAGRGAGIEREEPVSNKPWGTEKLQKYLCYVRDTFTSVRLSKDAERVVAKYYQSQRSADNRSAARTTVRLLESLIRLAQAHARLMCRTEVTLQDAVVSVICVETSLHSTAQLGMDSVLHSDFPPNPDDEFELQQGIILDRLNLSDLHRKRPTPSQSIPGTTCNRGGPLGSSQRSYGDERNVNDNTTASEPPSLTKLPSEQATDRRAWSNTNTSKSSESIDSTTRNHPHRMTQDPPQLHLGLGSDASDRGTSTGSANESRDALRPRGEPCAVDLAECSAPARSSPNPINSMRDQRQREGLTRDRYCRTQESEWESSPCGGDRTDASAKEPGREGGRWSGFKSGTPDSRAKRHRTSDDPGDDDGDGSGSGWGDVLFMSQQPLTPGPRR